MKKNIWLWQLGGITFVSVLGSILHFLYGWTNNNKIVALFSSVNESTWEHMKLLFFPALIYAIFQSFFSKKEFNSFWCVKLIGTSLGLILIPTFFYTSTGIFGTLPGWLNVIIFFVSVVLGFYYETFLFNKNYKTNCQKICIILFIIIAILFFIFTYFPPKIPLFLDPVFNIYGA
ncbi:MAG: hypothetical protein IKW33_01210 [Clostridia bacterium]|nr:hypothetical protein [Clostridia bacterium]